MLHLTWWQAFALAGSAVATVVVGKLFGKLVHRAVYRLSLLTHTPTDDRIVHRLEGPFEALAAVVTWEILISLYALPSDVPGFGRSLAQIGFLVALAWAAARVIDTTVEAIAVRAKWITGHRISQSLPIARRVTRVVLAVVTVVMILSSLSYSVGALIAGLGIVGIAVALAAQKTFENVFGAFAIGVDHPFDEGDLIKLDGGLVGTVEAIALRSTRIRTLDRTIVTVPNGKLADAQIESLTARDRLRFTIDLDATPAQRERVVGELTRMLRDHSQHGPEQPAVKLNAGTGSRCELEVIAWFQSASWAALETLREQLFARCLEIIATAGIGLHGSRTPALAIRSTGLRTAGGLS